MISEDEVSLKCCRSDTAPALISQRRAAAKVKTSAGPSAPHASPPTVKEFPTKADKAHVYTPVLQYAIDTSTGC